MRNLGDLGAALLRLAPPEAAHKLAVAALRAGFGPRFPAQSDPRLATHIAGLSLANPLGLAAGFDKNAVAPDALLAAGFGFVECGTATPRPQVGNPKPRLFRLREDAGVVNRMGFNNEGLDVFAARLALRANLGGIVGANVGANKDSADRARDYLAGLVAVWPSCAYVTMNVSSPNTPGLRGLQERGALEDLLGRVRETRQSLPGTRPLFLKVAPDLDDSAVADIVDISIANGLDGLIVSNTTIERPAHLKSRARGEAGGLSGRPLFSRSTERLATFARASRGRLALIGAGGVEDARTALAKIKAGASAVQLYTALVFAGPGLIARILQDLPLLLKSEGFASIRDAIGADLR